MSAERQLKEGAIKGERGGYGPTSIADIATQDVSSNLAQAQLLRLQYFSTSVTATYEQKYSFLFAITRKETSSRFLISSIRLICYVQVTSIIISICVTRDKSGLFIALARRGYRANRDCAAPNSPRSHTYLSYVM